MKKLLSLAAGLLLFSTVNANDDMRKTVEKLERKIKRIERLVRKLVKLSGDTQEKQK